MNGTASLCEKSFGLNVQEISGKKFYSVCKSGADGYKWQHGASVAFYNGKFYASWGRNKGEENTRGEQCVVMSSTDLCNWNTCFELVDDGDMGYSHGSIAVIDDKLYLFVPYFAGSDRQSPTGIRFRQLSMRVYAFDGKAWQRVGGDTDDFWPLQQPQKTDVGYVIAGINGLWQAAVAVSANLVDWQVVKPNADEARAFTESNCIACGNHLSLYVRTERASNPSCVTLGYATSEDGGLSWSDVIESDMPGNTSKVCAGKLENGDEFVVTNGIRGANRSRSSLTLAIKKAGEKAFSSLYLIRDSKVPSDLAEAYLPLTSQEAMSYPFVLEHEEKLYVIYSSFMSKGCNYNNIEMCVIEKSCMQG